nr:MAG TPA: hypothetical protein [Caudoviricetes sp.]
MPFACYGVARNLKFRPSENAKPPCKGGLYSYFQTIA